MSAKLSLFALALLCMCVFAQAQVKTSITVTIFNSGNCATGTDVSTNVYNSTTCYNYGDGIYIKYTANADGTFAYSSLFTESTCTTLYSQSVSEYVAGASTCFLTANSMTSARYVVANPSVGPADSFPPAGYIVTSNCFNATTHNAPLTTPCVASAGLFCYRTASKQCQLIKAYDSNNVIGSRWSQVSADGATISQLSFATQDCTGDVTRAQLIPNKCNSGVISYTASVKSVTLPTQGWIRYNSALCDSTYLNDVSLYATNVCFQSNRFGCSVINGTSTATFTTYSDNTNMGLCTTSNVVTYRNTESCYQGSLTSATKYVCNYNPNINAASSVSVSVVAMLAAAVVALFAGRQL